MRITTQTFLLLSQFAAKSESLVSTRLDHQGSNENAAMRPESVQCGGGAEEVVEPPLVAYLVPSGSLLFLMSFVWLGVRALDPLRLTGFNLML